MLDVSQLAMKVTDKKTKTKNSDEHITLSVYIIEHLFFALSPTSASGRSIGREKL